MSLEGVIDTEKVRTIAGTLRETDWTPVDRKLATKLGGQNYVSDLKEEAVRFLAIAAAGNASYAPSQQVDEYWHEMILNTERYAGMSQRVGGFIHHTPSEQPETDAYARTLAAYRAVFGRPNPAYWGRASESTCDTRCKGGTCAGSCTVAEPSAAACSSDDPAGACYSACSADDSPKCYSAKIGDKPTA